MVVPAPGVDLLPASEPLACFWLIRFFFCLSARFLSTLRERNETRPLARLPSKQKEEQSDNQNTYPRRRELAWFACTAKKGNVIQINRVGNFRVLYFYHLKNWYPGWSFLFLFFFSSLFYAGVGRGFNFIFLPPLPPLLPLFKLIFLCLVFFVWFRVPHLFRVQLCGTFSEDHRSVRADQSRSEQMTKWDGWSGGRKRKLRWRWR